MAQAQITNYVKNPSFEDTVKCPDENNQVSYSNYWHCAVDTVGEPIYAPEYYNICATSPRMQLPANVSGYQYPHTGNTYIGAHLYYDKTPPPPPRLLAYPLIGGIIFRDIYINLYKMAKLIVFLFG